MLRRNIIRNKIDLACWGLHRLPKHCMCKCRNFAQNFANRVLILIVSSVESPNDVHHWSKWVDVNVLTKMFKPNLLVSNYCLEEVSNWTPCRNEDICRGNGFFGIIIVNFDLSTPFPKRKPMFSSLQFFEKLALSLLPKRGNFHIIYQQAIIVPICKGFFTPLRICNFFKRTLRRSFLTGLKERIS